MSLAYNASRRIARKQPGTVKGLAVALWVAACVLVPRSARADESVAVMIARLQLPTGRVAVVRQLGVRWEEVRRESAYDDRAPAPRAFAAEVSGALVRLIESPATAAEETRLALRLIGDLADPSSEPLLLTRLASNDVMEAGAPASRTSLVARAAARLKTPGLRIALIVALARAAPADDVVPAESAWALCEALAQTELGAVAAVAERGAATTVLLDERIAEPVLRLFRFAPHAALASCLPLLLRAPGIADEARAVLDATPDEVDGAWPRLMRVGDGLVADPRDPQILIPSGRGAALVLLAETRAPDALRRLTAAMRDRRLESWRTRDGAVQGLGAIGGPRARRVLRASLGDRALRSPRAVHALLRLGDVASVRALHALALDRDAEIELRLAAANAYTLLAPARSDGASRYAAELEALGPIGAPFEALDARLAAFAPRLAVPAACPRALACTAGYLLSSDPQMAARAFWDLTRLGPRSGADAAALAEVAAATLARTPANTEHDRVAGAIALLARLEPAVARPHLATVRAAQAEWEGRTNPMGLPFDVPLALAQLASR